MTWPTLTLSPSFTLMSLTVPLTDEGTSTTALSVSNSITGWPSAIFAPGATIRRTRSPASMFSPSSGSLKSRSSIVSSSSPLTDRGIRFFGIDAEVLDRLLHYFRLQLPFARQRDPASPGRCNFASTSKKSRRDSRFSLRPKPSVPSATSGRGSQRESIPAAPSCSRKPPRKRRARP